MVYIIICKLQDNVYCILKRQKSNKQVVKSKKQRRITPKKVSDDMDSAHNDYFCDKFNKIAEPQCSNKLEDLELQVPYKIKSAKFISTKFGKE